MVLVPDVNSRTQRRSGRRHQATRVSFT
jgi:hypothetical protein